MTEEYTSDDLHRLGAKWLHRITMAEKREDDWFKQAESAERAYLCDASSGVNDVPEFNILHSNVETIVPSIYNSTPVPDIRPRHNNKDDLAKHVSEIYERAIAVQIDDSRLDAEVEKVAQDAFVAGRGVLRIKFDADVTDDMVTGERLEYEVVSWSDYREGPAKKWRDVPWVAFRHCISQEEVERLGDPELLAVSADPETMMTNPDDDVYIWEIWDKTARRVFMVVQDSNRVVKMEDDPLGLTGFFPMPEPVQPITGTGKRTPVCPYTVYKTLADELDKQTRRINAIVKGLKVRGIIATDAASIERLAEADDNELVPVGNIENLIAAGGLEKAVMWWPIEIAVAVLRELYVQREQTKQAIYEITGISDIIRGNGNASETATAQQIKTEWGALRIKKMQRLVERLVRDVFVISAEIISQHFTPRTLQALSGLPIMQEAAALIQSPLDHYRIDVESDSTVRADTSRNKREMAEFLQGTAQFFNTMAPIVQQAPASAGPIVEMYSAFARQFNLGKQAEDALEKFAEMAKQAAAQPRPNPEEEARKAEMQMKQMELQADGQIKQAEMLIKREELGIKREELEMKKQESAVGAFMEHERIGMDKMKAQTEREKASAELLASNDMVGAAMNAPVQAVIDEVRASHEGLVRHQAETAKFLADAINQGNQMIVAAMTAPKRVIKDASGRPIGVETVTEAQSNGDRRHNLVQ